MNGKLPSGRLKFLAFLVLAMMLVMIMAPVALAAEGGGEASLVLPDLGKVTFLGMSGQMLLTLGLIIVALGLGLHAVSEVQELPTEQYHVVADPLVFVAM